MGDNLLEIKKSLQDALGSEDFDRYLKLLKKWFSQTLTKEQFDTHARKLISPDKIHFHNALFMAILSKCNIQYSIAMTSSSTAATTSTPPSNKRKGFQALKQILNKAGASRGPEKRFRPSEPIQFSPTPKYVNGQSVQEVPSPISDNLTVCSKDGLLPDRSVMFGRALVIAWEHGMEEVDERLVDLVVLATRDLLKNVLHSAIQLRRNYVVSSSGFPHLFGVDASLTANSNNVQETNPLDFQSSQLVAASRSKPASPICLRDIYDGLQLHPGVLPCQTVRTMVLERILCKLDDKNDPKSDT